LERLALDTSFLIDLQNERRGRGTPVGAIAFLRARADAELLLPAVALGEYLEGFPDEGSAVAQALVAPLRVLEVTAEVARVYAAVARSLRDAGQLIGTNDLWIACTARAAAVPVVTRNAEHFRRVPELGVVTYVVAGRSASPSGAGGEY
jgi:predicted nucleic acid-binding protein